MDANISSSSVARGQALSGGQLHDLCMLYVDKLAYVGITPEQLATEYLLCHQSIVEYMKESNEQPAKPMHTPEGFKLQDNAREN